MKDDYILTDRRKKEQAFDLALAPNQFCVHCGETDLPILSTEIDRRTIFLCSICIMRHYQAKDVRYQALEQLVATLETRLTQALRSNVELAQSNVTLSAVAKDPKELIDSFLKQGESLSKENMTFLEEVKQHYEKDSV